MSHSAEIYMCVNKQVMANESLCDRRLTWWFVEQSLFKLYGFMSRSENSEEKMLRIGGGFIILVKVWMYVS